MTYLERIMAAQFELSALRPGGVYHVDVCHDSWCKTQRGKGGCNCDPDIFVNVGSDKYEVDRDGSIKR